jgi:hypothetical protein
MEEKISELTKKELIAKYISLKGCASKNSKKIYDLRNQIYLMRGRLIKVSNIIEYILTHPYSLKTGGYEHKNKRARRNG